MNELYKRQVALLIKIMPSIYTVKDFAIHGGTAIIFRLFNGSCLI